MPWLAVSWGDAVYTAGGGCWRKWRRKKWPGRGNGGVLALDAVACGRIEKVCWSYCSSESWLSAPGCVIRMWMGWG